MANLAAFRNRFEEFAQAPSAKVNQILEEAAKRTPASVWGDLRDEGILYLAAHLLANDPQARNMKLVSPADGRTTYDRERRRLALIVTSGFRVGVT